MNLSTPFNQLVDCRYGRMLHNRNDLYIGRSLQEYGEYGELELQLLRKIIAPGSIVVDVGANIGVHTLAFAAAVGPQGAVFAFEPQRLMFQTLCANVALNSLVHVWCQNLAVGESPGSVLVPLADPTVPGSNFGAMSLGQYTDGDSVPVVCLDSVSLPSCRLIKIDIEGMEAAALRGAKNFIARHRPMLYVESNPGPSVDGLRELIDSLGYNTYSHITSLFNPDNYFRKPQNIFGTDGSFNVLCVPRETDRNEFSLPPAPKSS